MPVKENFINEMDFYDALRDWFAGQALASIPVRSWEENGKLPDDVIDRWARCAYAVADAMLLEKLKK